MRVHIPIGRDNFEGGGRSIVKYRYTLRLAVQKRLNQSRCRSGFGLGWAHRSIYERNLANTIESSMCGGDAAFITLTTCLKFSRLNGYTVGTFFIPSQIRKRKNYSPLDGVRNPNLTYHSRHHNGGGPHNFYTSLIFSKLVNSFAATVHPK